MGARCTRSRSNRRSVIGVTEGPWAVGMFGSAARHDKVVFSVSVSLSLPLSLSRRFALRVTSTYIHV